MDNTSLRPTQHAGNLDFDGFTTLLKRLVYAAWGDEWGLFSEDYPKNDNPKDVKMPIITYSLLDMTPGVIGKNTREVKPRHRYTESIEENGQHAGLLDIKGQIMDITIRFTISHENNEKSRKLLKDWMDFMTTYHGYFLEKGISNLYFLKAYDGPKSSAKEDISVRTVDYLLRLEELTVIPREKVRDIILAVENE